MASVIDSLAIEARSAVATDAGAQRYGRRQRNRPPDIGPRQGHQHGPQPSSKGVSGPAPGSACRHRTHADRALRC